MTTQQLVEREPVAALRGGDQGGVIEVARNAASVTNPVRALQDLHRARGGAPRAVVDELHDRCRADVLPATSAGDGDLAEAAAVRVRGAAGAVLSELLEQDQHMSCRRGGRR